MSNRRPNSPWLSLGRGNHVNILRHSAPKRRVIKANRRLRFVVEGAVRNGLVACPYCGIVKKGHEITDPVHWKRNDESGIARLNPQDKQLARRLTHRPS